MNTHDKGSRWRRAVSCWLDEHGFTTRFRGIGEAGDDITAHRGRLELSVEAKNWRTVDLAGWVGQAQSNAPAGAVPVVIAHRKGHASVNDSYVILSGREFARLVTLLDQEGAGPWPTSTPSG